VLSERFERVRCKLWTQEFGGRTKMLGLAHGFAGNACASIRAGRARALELEIERTLDATAQLDGGLANWPQSVGPPRPGRTAPLVQICHGAPGVIVARAARAAPGSRLGACAWAASHLAGGSARKARGCVTEPRNGYAFLFVSPHGKSSGPSARARSRCTRLAVEGSASTDGAASL
jgi:hypothetical protein